MKKSYLFHSSCVIITALLVCLCACSNGNESVTGTDTDTSVGTEAMSGVDTSFGAITDSPIQTENITLGGYENPYPSNPPVTQAPDNITDVQNSNYSRGLSYISLGNGTCTVSGMGSCTDSCVVIPRVSPNGEIVVSISDKAFFGLSSISAVFLPSSIADIGSMAFAACPSLAYFSVDASNLAYRDTAGVLYSADGSTLISYPAAKSSSSVTIPASVKNIADMAFYGCTKLTAVAYSGTLAQWQRINIGSGNNSLIGLNIQYQSSGK